MRAIKDIRLQHYDYSTNGYYFVTITTKHRKPHLEDLYELIEKTIKDLNLFDGVEVNYFTIMPDHLHLILILENCQLKLGEIIRRLKAVTSKQAGFKLWQPNYYEHVIRNEMAISKIREYIVNNPAVELIEFERFYMKS